MLVKREMPTTSDVRTLQRARLASVGLGTLRAADDGGVPGVVARLGAVQSQELHSSAWGVAQRLALAQGPLTRKEIRAVLAEAEGTPLDTWHLGQVMAHAELDLLVASGPMRGKQATYRLLPEQKAWLTRHELAGLTLWADGDLPGPAPAGTVRLLSVFDELFCHDFKGWPALSRDGVPSRWLYAGIVVLDGMIAGAWSRALKAQTVEITVELTEEPARKIWAAIESEAERYGRFCGLDPILTRGQEGKGTIG
jgi:hypothetical protein